MHKETEINIRTGAEEFMQGLCILTHAQTYTYTHLCLCDGGGAFVFLREEEADGHEEFEDADSELLLVLASRGQREEPARLNDVLEDVLAGLEDRKKHCHLLGGGNDHTLHPVKEYCDILIFPLTNLIQSFRTFICKRNDVYTSAVMMFLIFN